MSLEEKLLKLDTILEKSELVKMAEEHFDEETVEEMMVELKKELINLLEEK